MRRALLGLLLAPAAAWGQPMSSSDPRIQTIAYRDDAVVPLRVASGFVATILLAPDERIENVALGDTAGWQVTANKQADRLFVKPLSSGGATNLEVVTAARHYSFVLSAAPPGDPGAVLFVRFDYAAASGAAPVAAGPSALPAAAGYRLSGARTLWPSSIGDDGVRTTLCWPEHGPQPVIYRADVQGADMLANARLAGRCWIIDDISQRYRFEAAGQRAFATRQLRTKARR